MDDPAQTPLKKGRGGGERTLEGADVGIPRRYRHRWTGAIDFDDGWIESQRRDGWMIIIMGSVLLAFFIAVPVVIIFFVSETSYLEKLILSLIFLLLFPALALMMVGTGVEAIRRPTQRVILMIDMDDEGFKKWVKGGLLYSQIEGQLNDSHVAYERRKPYGSDIVYRLASGIEIQVRHSKSIVVDDDGERSMVWVVVAIEDITAGRLEEGRALQALLDDLPMFGEEFRMSDILVHPH